MATYPAPTVNTVFNTVDYPTTVDTNVKKTGTNIMTGSLTFNHVTTISSSSWIILPTSSSAALITSTEAPILASTGWSGLFTFYFSDQASYSGTMFGHINKPVSGISITPMNKIINASVNAPTITLTSPNSTTVSFNTTTTRTTPLYLCWTLSYAKYPL